MIKSFPVAAKTPPDLKFGSKNSFEDYQPSNSILCTQAYEKLRHIQTPKLSLLEINRDKVNKRNKELMKLFKETKPEYMNIELLEKSQFMHTNQLFYYLVNCLKKQRQGLISVQTLSQEKAKAPKLIEIKIREFLYNSLQQSLLMSEKQVEQSKYFERLFKWFTEVFQETQMKLSFKLEPLKNDSKQHDQEWIIRNTFKSSMPQELGQYQRKMLNTKQMNDFNQRISRNGHRYHSSAFDLEQDIHQNQTPAPDSIYTQNGHEKKLFTQNSHFSSMQRKSNEILPILARKGFHTELQKLKQQKELSELKVYEMQWKRLRANFGQHSAKNFNQRHKQKQAKVGEVSLYNSRFSSKSKKGKDCSSSFSLEPKIFDKIQAAKMGVTLTEFKKNKENLLKQNSSTTYDSPVYHPYLTSSYFHDIKKKKLETLRKTAFAKQFKYNPKNTDESEDVSSANHDGQNLQGQDMEDEFNPAIPEQNPDEIVENIDGLGLCTNPLDKGSQKSKKK